MGMRILWQDSLVHRDELENSSVSPMLSSPLVFMLFPLCMTKVWHWQFGDTVFVRSAQESSHSLSQRHELFSLPGKWEDTEWQPYYLGCLAIHSLASRAGQTTTVFKRCIHITHYHELCCTHQHKMINLILKSYIWACQLISLFRVFNGQNQGIMPGLSPGLPER